MPTYRFQCQSCGLSFTSRGNPDVKDAKCQCGQMAPRVLPQGVNVTVSGGAVNTATDTVGLSGVDYNFDRAVGASAQKNWGHIRDRQRDKIDLAQANGATGFDLSRNPDGTYRVMTPEERVASERARGFHFQALDKLKKDKP